MISICYTKSHQTNLKLRVSYLLHFTFNELRKTSNNKVPAY